MYTISQVAPNMCWDYSYEVFNIRMSYDDRITSTFKVSINNIIPYTISSKPKNEASFRRISIITLRIRIKSVLVT